MSNRREMQIAEAILDSFTEPANPDAWWRGAMLYEIYVRSFRDSSGDGIGDLPGILEKLDYLADLGVDGIWLSPFYPSPQVDFGYDITDLRGVDPLHGTMDDMLTLIEAVHDRDLRILIDFAPCHTSDEHPWFAESRQSRDNDRADWYVWADPAPDGMPPNNWLSSFGGSAWEWEPKRAQFYFHPFLKCQPALNLRNEDALNAVLDSMIFWRDLGIDGFRLDAVQCLCWDETLRNNPPSRKNDIDVAIGGGPNNPFKRQEHHFDRDVPYGLEIIERMRKTLSDGYPDLALVGELADVDSSRFAVKYCGGDRRLHAVYDFDIINAGEDIDHWKELLGRRLDFLGNGWLYNVFTNHDSVRAISNLTPTAVEARRADDAAKLLLFLQATLRGGAIIYQGEELGLPQPELEYDDLRDPWAKNLWPDFEGRDGVRTPMPWKAEGPSAGFSDGDKTWMAVPDEHRPLSVERQDADDGSVLAFFRALMRWRRDHPALRRGEETIHESGRRPLLVFDRQDGDLVLRVVANLGLDDSFLPDAGGEALDCPGATLSPGENGYHVPGLGFGVIARKAARS